MAKCKLCKVNIPEGTEYCKDCQDKELMKSNESYLDSLLNSVKNNGLTAESVYKKKSNSASDNPLMNAQEDSDNLIADEKVNEVYDEVNDEVYDEANDEVNDEVNDIFADEGNDIVNDEVYDTVNDNSNIIEATDEYSSGYASTDNDISDVQDDYSTIDLKDIADFDQFDINADLTDTNDIGDMDEIKVKDLFGEEFSHLFAEAEGAEAKPVSGMLQEESGQDIDREEGYEQVIPSEDFDQEGLVSEINQQDGSLDEYNQQYVSQEDNNRQDISLQEESAQLNDDNSNVNDLTDFIGADNIDSDLNALLDSLENDYNTERPIQDDITGMSSDDTIQQDPGFDGNDEDQSSELADINLGGEAEDDILSLLNQISSDDPVAEDIWAISDILNGVPEEAKQPSDVGEVFSDALKAVSTLKDLDGNESDLYADAESSQGKKEKKKKAKKKSKKNDADLTELGELEEKPKKSLIKKLFANVEDEKAKSKGQKSVTASDEVAASKADTKKAKSKKNKKAAADEIDEAFDDTKAGKNKSGKAAKADKKKEKKEAKEKKKKTKEVIQVIDEIEEDEGRINRLGAFIVFLFFGLLAALLLVGTEVVSYSLSIQHATNYFDKQKYTQAYNEVYGIEIKDEDIEIYDKIMTVMFVNKQLNSYNNFYSIGKYPQALDSLLKGLKRYDKYIELATMLGINTDLDYVRDQILAELERVFHLTEDEAILLNNYSSMQEYSLQVYDIVLERMDN